MVPADSEVFEKWLLEGFFPLCPALILGVTSGIGGLIVGLIVSPALWLVVATPIRVRIQGAEVGLDFLPFGLCRRTFEGRSLSYEVRLKTLEIGLPRRLLGWHDEVRLARPGDSKLRSALDAVGATRITSS